MGTLNGAAANGVDSSGNMVDTALESDDEWWDAASFGSMRSAMSHISLDDVLDQWRDDMGDELAELEAAARSQAMEGRALSADIDRAATASSLGDSSLGLKLPPGESQLTGGRSSVLVDTAAPLGPQPSGPLVQQMEDFVRRASLPRNDPASVLVSEARELLALGRVLEAHAKLLQLCAQSGLDLPHLASHSDDLDIDIDALEADVAAVHAALAGLDDDSGYMVSRDDEFRVLYKHHVRSDKHQNVVICAR